MPSNNNLLGLIMRNKGGAGQGASMIEKAQGDSGSLNNWYTEEVATKNVSGMSTEARITLTQRGNLITVSGTWDFPTRGGPSYHFYNLGDGLSNGSNIDATMKHIVVKPGHKYGVKSKYVSGSITGSGIKTISVGLMKTYLEWLCHSNVPGDAIMYDYTDVEAPACVFVGLDFVNTTYSTPHKLTFNDYTFSVEPVEEVVQNGITVGNVGREYRLNGTGTDDGCMYVSVLDGCVPWMDRENTVKLKKGGLYKLIMQVSNYPTAQNTGTGTERRAPEAVQLTLYQSSGTALCSITPTQNNPAVFSVDQDMEAQLQLAVATGYANTGERITYNDMRLLLTLCQVSGGEEITYNMPLSGDSWQEIERGSRVSAEDGTAIACIGHVVDVIGIPNYVDDVSQQSDYHITEKGWYLFCKVQARPKTVYTAEGSITGAAGYIDNAGGDCVYLAVKFEVAAQAQLVKIRWDADTEETYIFRAHDLAIRNLDYMTTFYVYDISRYITWEYALTTDTVFQKNKEYYIHDPMAEAADSYIKADVETEAYVLTADTTFAADKTYYTKEGDEYTAATVTAGEAVPADTYYEQTTVPVPADTYYNHSKVHFEGMAPNVTYKLDELIDCPIEIALPDIPENGHGAWFEIQMRFNATYSITLLPVTEVKIGTAQTQAQTAGINTVDLQYTAVNGVKMWTLLNTHSNIPTT